MAVRWAKLEEFPKLLLLRIQYLVLRWLLNLGLFERTNYRLGPLLWWWWSCSLKDLVLTSYFSRLPLRISASGVNSMLAIMVWKKGPVKRLTKAQNKPTIPVGPVSLYPGADPTSRTA